MLCSDFLSWSKMRPERDERRQEHGVVRRDPKQRRRVDRLQNLGLGGG